MGEGACMSATTNRRGRKPTGQELLSACADEVIAEYSRGCSTRDISAQVFLSATTVVKRLRANGVRVRGKSERVKL